MEGPEAMEQILFALRKKNEQEKVDWWCLPHADLQGRVPMDLWGEENDALVALAEADFQKENLYG